ncbi:MAG: hypothetical protein WEA09_09045 [Gemmatimonadota bacterium]
MSESESHGGANPGPSPDQGKGGLQLGVAERLRCPRCGPAYPLILLATQAGGQRVQTGELGCPNCRDRYPVKQGIADLRQARERLGSQSGDHIRDGTPPVEVSSRLDLPTSSLAALLGVTQGPARILLVGMEATVASGLLEAMQIEEGVEVVVAGPMGKVPNGLLSPCPAGVVVVGGSLPFQEGGFHAVAVDSDVGARWLDQLPPLLRSGARLVVVRPGPEHPERLRSLGLALLLNDPRAAVGVAT